MELKRDLVKYIRDKAKSKYQKGCECEICGTTENLDFHHFYSLSPLLAKWVKFHKLDPALVLEWRDDFISKHSAELYEHRHTMSFPSFTITLYIWQRP